MSIGRSIYVVLDISIIFPQIAATIPKCGSCGGMILDRFILKVVDQPWHAKCLTCAVCAQPLREKCFVKNNEVFCREDFFRKYGTKCSGCGEGIAPSSVVRRAQDNVYHVDCFMCVLCNRKLDTGDEFYLMEDKKLLCKQDYDSAKAKGSEQEKFPGGHLSFFFSGRLRRRSGRKQATSHHYNCPPDGGSEKCLQNQSQTRQTRQGAACRRHRARHEGGPGLVPK